MVTAYIQTPLGVAQLSGDETGVAVIHVLDGEHPLSPEIPIELQDAATQLEQYFARERTHFDFAINPQGSDFQKRVWRELLNIPFGKTVSYMDVTKKLGDIKAVRAVASANGKNPLWIVVPCHRVVGTDGSLTGYAGGLWRKQWLLEHESATWQQRLFDAFD
jgi:methylated-DNA-[protein]-cysteine S-methyltransferase